MDVTYSEIWEANSQEVQRKFAIFPDQLKVVHRAHAITMRRLANSPGWWKDDDSTNEVVALSLEDVKRDFEEHGIKGMIERWAMKKVIEAIIEILVVYLRTEYGQESSEFVGAAAFDGANEQWATEADKVLQEF
jgi:hypothetical protein